MFHFVCVKGNFIPRRCFAHLQSMSVLCSLTQTTHVQKLPPALLCPCDSLSRHSFTEHSAKGNAIQRKAAIAEMYPMHQQDVNPTQCLPFSRMHTLNTIKILGYAPTWTV